MTALIVFLTALVIATLFKYNRDENISQKTFPPYYAVALFTQIAGAATAYVAVTALEHTWVAPMLLVVSLSTFIALRDLGKDYKPSVPTALFTVVSGGVLLVSTVFCFYYAW